MNTIAETASASYTNTFTTGLSLQDVRQRAPAAFAASADPRMSARYTIQTERVLAGLMQAGFVPMDARQARPRKGSALHT
ncbi:MAG TPA: hypothetical protein VIT67_12590, partial [Povalibacter sp.]